MKELVILVLVIGIILLGCGILDFLGTRFEAIGNPFSVLTQALSGLTQSDSSVDTSSLGGLFIKGTIAAIFFIVLGLLALFVAGTIIVGLLNVFFKED